MTIFHQADNIFSSGFYKGIPFYMVSKYKCLQEIKLQSMQKDEIVHSFIYNH